MQIRIDVYIHSVREAENVPPLWAVAMMSQMDLLRSDNDMANAQLQQRLDAAATSISDLTTVVGSVDALLDANTQMLRDIKVELEANGVDPAQLTALDDAIAAVDANRAALTTSVTENTIAANEPPADPNANPVDPNAPVPTP